jgi:hypothetical protein
MLLVSPVTASTSDAAIVLSEEGPEVTKRELESNTSDPAALGSDEGSVSPSSWAFAASFWPFGAKSATARSNAHARRRSISTSQCQRAFAVAAGSASSASGFPSYSLRFRGLKSCFRGFPGVFNICLAIASKEPRGNPTWRIPIQHPRGINALDHLLCCSQGRSMSAF